jgi:site-specific DNA-methyltransferase (adenine-specific)
VLGRDGAEIGVLLTLKEPTKPMREEAASHGIYRTRWGDHPRLQILTIEDLLGSKRISMPPPSRVGLTFKRAPKVQREASGAVQASLLDAAEGNT